MDNIVIDAVAPLPLWDFAIDGIHADTHVCYICIRCMFWQLLYVVSNAMVVSCERNMRRSSILFSGSCDFS